MSEKVRLGVSRCLLGENVRYDSGHRRHAWAIEVLSTRAELAPVCPEVECGLGVPRERMHLEGDPAAPRLVATFTGTDHTNRMLRWARRRVKELATEALCGFILKARSPSCGLRGVPVRTELGRRRRGRGLFAGALTMRLPLLPVIDESRLDDEAERENFLERVFALHRWQVMLASGGTRGDLEQFHAENRLLIMAHNPRRLRALDRLVAGAKSQRLAVLRREYLEGLMGALRPKATVMKRCQVLHHILGLVAGSLTARERRRGLGLIERYRHGRLPLGAPTAFIENCVRRHGGACLRRQTYFCPYAPELFPPNSS